MKITYRAPAGASDLAAVYNEQLAGVPHCYPVSGEEFEQQLPWSARSSDPPQRLHTEQLILAEQAGRTVGFAHVALRDVEVEGTTRRGGVIRFLTYQPSHRPTGQRLLEEAETYLAAHGAEDVRAFQKPCAYPFYHLSFGMLSDRMAHVYGLVRMNGYATNEGEIFMARRGAPPPRPAPPDAWADVIVQRPAGRGELPGLTVRAVRDGEQIGVCRSISAGEYCRAAAAQRSLFTEWLGVEPDQRGVGWGRYLLLRSLWEMQRLGYRDAFISAGWTNFRALLLYTNYGYQVTDTVYGLVKDRQGQ